MTDGFCLTFSGGLWHSLGLAGSGASRDPRVAPDFLPERAGGFFLMAQHTNARSHILNPCIVLLTV